MAHCYKWSSHLNFHGGFSTIAFLGNQGTDREINDILLTNCCLRLLKCYKKLSPCHTWMTIKNRILQINEARYCLLWASNCLHTGEKTRNRKYRNKQTNKPTNKQTDRSTWCPQPTTMLMGSLCRKNFTIKTNRRTNFQILFWYAVE
jgi:hypothetical protein